MSHRYAWIFFWVMTLLLIVFTNVLWVVVVFEYDVEVFHAQEATCEVNDCVITTQTCSYTTCSSTTNSGQNCYTNTYTCYALSLQLILYLKGVEYAGSYSGTFSNYPDVCYSNTTTCYYDDRSIDSSLTLTANDPLLAGIVLICVFTIATAIILIIWIVSLVLLCSVVRRPSASELREKLCCCFRRKETETGWGITPGETPGNNV